jgi:hypothetical protein
LNYSEGTPILSAMQRAALTLSPSIDISNWR